MKCPKCGQQLLSDATTCHKCGKEIIIQLEKNSYKLAYFVAPIVIVLAITAFLLGSYSHRNETSTLGSASDNPNDYDEYDDSDLESFVSGEETDTPTEETTDTYEAQTVIEDTDTSVAATEVEIETDTDTHIPINTYSDTRLFEGRILGFRHNYETAVNEGNYSYVQEYILPQSQAEQELSEFVGDMSGKNYHYNFIRTEIVGVQLIDGGALVDTFEIFDFTDDQGKETHYERFKTYVMEVDSSGVILISAIKISDTDKQ